MQFVGVSTKGFSNKIMNCLFCLSLCWREKQRKDEKKGKGQFRKYVRTIVFLGVVVNQRVFFLAKMAFFRQIDKHYLCLEGKKRAFSSTLSVFGKWHFFCDLTKSPNSTQIWGFSRHIGKIQKGTFGCKSAILERDFERGFYYLWYTKAVLCRKHSF